MEDMLIEERRGCIGGKGRDGARISLAGNDSQEWNYALRGPSPAVFIRLAWHRSRSDG